MNIGNEYIEELFDYANDFEKMKSGDVSISKSELACKFVDLVCISRDLMASSFCGSTLSEITHQDQFKLMHILDDIFGLPSTWSNYESQPKVSKSLLQLEKDYGRAFKINNNYKKMSYAFCDYMDFIPEDWHTHVSEQIIMLADAPLR